MFLKKDTNNYRIPLFGGGEVLTNAQDIKHALKKPVLDENTSEKTYKYYIGLTTILVEVTEGTYKNVEKTFFK